MLERSDVQELESFYRECGLDPGSPSLRDSVRRAFNADQSTAPDRIGNQWATGTIYGHHSKNGEAIRALIAGIKANAKATMCLASAEGGQGKAYFPADSGKQGGPSLNVLFLKGILGGRACGEEQRNHRRGGFWSIFVPKI